MSASSDTNSVMIDAIALPAAATGFHVYRGSTSNQLFRIALEPASIPGLY